MTLKIYRAGKLHKVIGYAFILLGFFTCGAGLLDFLVLYGKFELRVLGVVNMYANCIIVAIFECCHRKKRFGKDPLVVPEKSMTI
jgi:hypothetical protein